MENALVPPLLSPPRFPAPWADMVVAELLSNHLAKGREELDDDRFGYPARVAQRER